jgi:hypothetical protein
MLSQHADLRRLANCIGVCTCFCCFSVSRRQSEHARQPHRHSTVPSILHLLRSRRRVLRLPIEPGDRLICSVCPIYTGSVGRSPPCRGASKQQTHTVSHLTAAMAIPCMNLTVAASGVFQFKVEYYSFTKENNAMSERAYYQSDAFRVGRQDWAVGCDEGGYRDGCQPCRGQL